MVTISTKDLQKLILEELDLLKQSTTIEEAKEDDVWAKYGAKLPYKEDWDRFVRWINEKEPRVQTEPQGEFRDGKSHRPNRIKFLNWGTKWLINHGEEDDAISELLTALRQFEKHAKQFKKKDINQYKDVAELEKAYQTDVLDKRIAKARKKREKTPGWAQDPSHAGIIHEDDRFFVVRPESVEGSCFYGEKTKWCISGKDVDPATGEIIGYNKYYDQYTKEGKVFYFIKDDTANENDQFASLALEMDYNGFVRFWDRDDGAHDPDDIYSIGWPEESVTTIMDAINEHFQDNPAENIIYDELINIGNEIDAGDYNTDILSIYHYFDDYHEEPPYYFQVTASVKLTVALPFVTNLLNTIDSEEITTIIDDYEEEILEKIAIISPFDDFIDPDNDEPIEINYEWSDNLLVVAVEINLNSQDTGVVAGRDDVEDIIEYYKHNFADRETLSEEIIEIHDIFSDVIHENVETSSKGKYLDIHKNIKDIESGFERMFAIWDAEDPSDGISFVLAQSLPINIPVVPKVDVVDVPQKWAALGGQWQKYYVNNYKNISKVYRASIRKIVNSEGTADTNIKSIFNNALAKYSDNAYAAAKRQVRFDFPDFKMSEPEKEFENMEKNMFNKFDINTPVPLELEGKAASKPGLRIRGSIDFDWANTVEEIDFSVLWAQYIDNHWDSIYKEMASNFGPIEKQIKQSLIALLKKFEADMENEYERISARINGIAGNRNIVTEWMKRLYESEEADFTIKIR